SEQVLIDCLRNEVELDGAIVTTLNWFPGFFKALMKSFTAKPRNETICSVLEKTAIMLKDLVSIELRELPSLVKEMLKAGNKPFAKCTNVSPPLPTISKNTREKMESTFRQLKSKGIEL
ncbi:MAG: hypothetical protein ACTSRA_07665, partial [Promethearchaeota archaeon]